MTAAIDWILDQLAVLMAKLGIVAASFVREWREQVPRG